MFSDRFKNCARPSITETEEVRGQKITFPKPWERYTIEEKALAINYTLGAGYDLLLMVLQLEKENEDLKAAIAAYINGR